MHARKLVLLSGLALTISAGTAIGQNRGTTEPREGQETQQDRQDRLERASQAARDRESRYGASSNILTSLEGIWNVKVQVNRTNWDAMNAPTGDRGSQERRDETNPQRNETDERRERAERQAERGERQGANPQREQDMRAASVDGMARSHTILGGDILRTTVLFGQGVPQSDGTRNDGRERDADRMRDRAAGGQLDPNSLQSVSFLGYNDRADEYQLALMTGQGGAIHYFTGKYDPGARRIVFTSTDRTPQSSLRDEQDGANRNDDATSSIAQTGTTEGMSVVLQLEGDDRYTVTAYRGPTSVETVTQRGTDLGGQPTQRREDGREADKRQDRYDGRATIAPNVIYKATYTKADAGMRSQHDRLFDEHDRNERSTSRSR